MQSRIAKIVPRRNIIPKKNMLATTAIKDSKEGCVRKYKAESTITAMQARAISKAIMIPKISLNFFIEPPKMQIFISYAYEMPMIICLLQKLQVYYENQMMNVKNLFLMMDILNIHMLK